MRICYIGDGQSVHNHFMIDWFRKRGHNLLFLTDTPEYSPHCEVREVVKRHGGGPLRHLIAGWRVRSMIHQWQPDIVHAHNITGYGYWGGMSGFSPLVMTAWGSDLLVFAKNSLLVRKMAQFSMRRADLITADANDLCDTAARLAGNKADVRLLQWGVDLDEFDKELTESVRDNYRDGKEIVFLSTRRLRPIYNIDVIIKAYAAIRNKIPPSRLIIVGEDFLSEQLKNLCQDLKIEQHTHFTGWVERDDYVNIMKSADIFISIPTSDSTALSLLEAFAARSAVITGDLKANKEWITDNQNGLLVEPQNVDALADAMVDAASDPERINQWGEFNRIMVEERGERQKEMLRLERMYEELLCKKKT